MNKTSKNIIRILLLILIVLCISRVNNKVHATGQDNQITQFEVKLIEGKKGYKVDNDGFAFLYSREYGVTFFYKEDYYEAELDDYTFNINGVTYKGKQEANKYLKTKNSNYIISCDPLYISEVTEQKGTFKFSIVNTETEEKISECDVPITLHIKGTTGGDGAPEVTKISLKKGYKGYETKNHLPVFDSNGRVKVDIKDFVITINGKSSSLFQYAQNNKLFLENTPNDFPAGTKSPQVTITLGSTAYTVKIEDVPEITGQTDGVTQTPAKQDNGNSNTKLVQGKLSPIVNFITYIIIPLIKKILQIIIENAPKVIQTIGEGVSTITSGS